ncbi:MAG: phosphatase PAP2 family protein [Oscillospiraceae bacterium]|nr:phosphatase PAP2 family protein [Oscillospiraceae bacterium]MBR0522573.1 phosphatase PAP2 family protein [Bacillota bacterium]
MIKKTKTVLLTLTGAYLLLMVVFTLFDLPISLRLYHPGTAYAKFFELFGTVPMPIMGIFASISFLMLTWKREMKLWKKLLLCFVILLNFMYFFFIGSFSIRDAVPGLFYPSLIIYAGWGVFSICIAKKNMVGPEKEIFCRLVMVLFIVCAVGVIGEDIIKTTFGRIRFYRLTDPVQEFRPWYVIQSHEFNSSFPSGHAAKAAMPFAVFVLPYMTDKLKTAVSRRSTLILCTIFMLGTWLARIMDGMHYATDVLTGSFIVLITFLLCKAKYLDSYKEDVIQNPG